MKLATCIKIIQPLLITLTISLFNSCGHLNQNTATNENKLIKTLSYLNPTSPNPSNLPALLAKSGEKADIIMDPRFMQGNSPRGFKLSLQSFIVEQGIRTKGAFIIYHYNDNKAPKPQTKKFDFISKSGQPVNIPIQIGYHKTYRSIMAGKNNKGENFKKETTYTTAPDFTTLQLRISEIDALR